MTQLTVSPDSCIFSVKELSTLLKNTIENTFSHVRVRGEVSTLKHPSSGHIYCTLKDQEAVIDAVCWRGTTHNHPVRLEEGLEIIATGRLTIYDRSSRYQLVIERFEPAGQGALLKLLEERKKRLAEEGLFALHRKQALPAFPQIIGVITSPTGAVIQDILHRLNDRFPCHVLLWPVPVQGQEAAEKIAAAIEGFNRPNGILPRPDVLIVARGGGSLEDLWAFNEECVMRAVAANTIPLISAIGHETDTTLIDFVADKRAPTPTAAAEMCVPVRTEIWGRLTDFQRQILRITTQLLNHHEHHITSLSRAFRDPQRLLESKAQRLDEWHERLHRACQATLHHRQHCWRHVHQRLRPPTELLQLYHQKSIYIIRSFYKIMRQCVDLHYQSCSLLFTRLENASYQKTLGRGFCLAFTQEGSLLAQVKQVPPYVPFKIQFMDGEVCVNRYTTFARRLAKPSSKKPTILETLKLF